MTSQAARASVEVSRAESRFMVAPRSDHQIRTGEVSIPSQNHHHQQQQQQQQQRQRHRPSRAGFYQNTFVAYDKPSVDTSTLSERHEVDTPSISLRGSRQGVYDKEAHVVATRSEEDSQHRAAAHCSPSDRGAVAMLGSGTGGEFRGGTQPHQPTSSYPPHMGAIDLDPGAMMTIPTIIEPESTPAPAPRPQRSALHKAKALKENLLVRKMTTLLQDNRIESGDMQAKLRDMNRSQEASRPILKRILNVLFITIGVALLLAVIIVIIYTRIVTQNTGKARSKGVIRASVLNTTPPSNVSIKIRMDEVERVDKAGDDLITVDEVVVADDDRNSPDTAFLYYEDDILHLEQDMDIPSTTTRRPIRRKNGKRKNDEGRRIRHTKARATT